MARTSIVQTFFSCFNAMIDRFLALDNYSSIMLILSIEQSTSVSSIALLNDDSVVTERVWDDQTSRNQHLFTVMPELLKNAGIEPPSIDLFTIGLGPGAFSALRISLSAMRGLALPDSKPVFGISSAEALAWHIIHCEQKQSVAVIGDARRDSLWLAIFDVSGNFAKIRLPFGLTNWNRLPGDLKPGDVAVTPDWIRIGERLSQALPSTVELIKEKRVPSASDVGKLALMKLRNGESSLPLKPIYLHPPVFVAPKFPTDPAAGR
jgi:tRNA threonylcarbamoyladenosine biosynthesis protein TsaB